MHKKLHKSFASESYHSYIFSENSSICWRFEYEILVKSPYPVLHVNVALYGYDIFDANRFLVNKKFVSKNVLDTARHSINHDVQ